MDPRIETIRVKFGLEKNDFWELPQKRGTYCIKHSAVEVVAAKSGVVFEMPVVLEADSLNGLASIVVRGTLGDHTVWSIGECSPNNYKNNKNAYPWAMAEKRAIDRVVLKLIGLHGLVYSEEESDDFKEQPAPPPKPATASKGDDARNLYTTLETAMRMATTKAELTEWWKNPTNASARHRLPTDWLKTLTDECGTFGKSLPEGHKEAAE